MTTIQNDTNLLGNCTFPEEHSEDRTGGLFEAVNAGKCNIKAYVGHALVHWLDKAAGISFFLSCNISRCMGLYMTCFTYIIFFISNLNNNERHHLLICGYSAPVHTHVFGIQGFSYSCRPFNSSITHGQAKLAINGNYKV